MRAKETERLPKKTAGVLHSSIVRKADRLLKQSIYEGADLNKFCTEILLVFNC